MKTVKSGFLNHKEINTVTYDPRVISIEKMKAVLIRAGTFIGIAGD